MQNQKDLLIANGVTDLDGWQLTDAYKITPDGLTRRQTRNLITIWRMVRRWAIFLWLQATALRAVSRRMNRIGVPPARRDESQRGWCRGIFQFTSSLNACIRIVDSRRFQYMRLKPEPTSGPVGVFHTLPGIWKTHPLFERGKNPPYYGTPEQ
jgi:hypothetical protein